MSALEQGQQFSQFAYSFIKKKNIMLSSHVETVQTAFEGYSLTF